MTNSIKNLKNYLNKIPNLEVIDNYSDVKRLSRDFYNYSPVLQKKLDGCLADVVVRPKNIESLLAVSKICWDLSIPLTTRGGGTGNYGQCVPLKGGVIMIMTKLIKIIEFKKNSVTS